MERTIKETTIRNILNRPCIPVIQELRKIPSVSDLTTGLVMQEVEYHFYRQPAGYFMFYAPHYGHPDYRLYESWSERLGISSSDFKVEFDKIGVRYGSRREFDSAQGDKFDGKFYCSIYDRNRRQALYLRNHELTDRVINQALDGMTVANYYEELEKEKQQHNARILEEVERRKQNGESNFSDLLLRAVSMGREEE